MYTHAALVLGIRGRNAILVLRMPLEDKTHDLRICLVAMAGGEDVWRGFLALCGRFMLHMLNNDYGFLEDYDQHARQERGGPHGLDSYL